MTNNNDNNDNKPTTPVTPFQEATYRIYDLGGHLLTETPVPKSELEAVKKALSESGKKIGIVKQLLFS